MSRLELGLVTHDSRMGVKRRIIESSAVVLTWWYSSFLHVDHESWWSEGFPRTFTVLVRA